MKKTLYPETYPELPRCDFYGDNVCANNNVIESSLYVEMLVATIFMYRIEFDPQSGYYTSESVFGVLQPKGIGLVTFTAEGSSRTIALVMKVDDNWTSPEDTL